VFPVQQLQMGAGSIEKNEHITAGGLFSQLIPNQSAEPVEAFAHITGIPIKIERKGRMEREHQ